LYKVRDWLAYINQAAAKSLEMISALHQQLAVALPELSVCSIRSSFSEKFLSL
jgi:hypothetical protein